MSLRHNLALRLCRAVAIPWALTFLVAAWFARPAEAASTAAEESAGLLAQIEPRFKAIYERDEFAIRSFTATWLPDGSGYLKLETPVGATVAEIARYDAASGERTVVVPSEKLVVPGSSQPLMLRWFQLRRRVTGSCCTGKSPTVSAGAAIGCMSPSRVRCARWMTVPDFGLMRMPFRRMASGFWLRAEQI